MKQESHVKRTEIDSKRENLKKAVSQSTSVGKRIKEASKNVILSSMRKEYQNDCKSNQNSKAKRLNAIISNNDNSTLHESQTKII